LRILPSGFDLEIIPPAGEEGPDEEGSDEEGSDEEGSDEEGSDEEGSDEEGSDEEDFKMVVSSFSVCLSYYF